MGKAVEIKEPGAKRSQFILSNDETQSVLNESYVNLEAVLTHLKGDAVQTILSKIFNICKLNRFEEFGDVNKDLMSRSLL